MSVSGSGMPLHTLKIDRQPRACVPVITQARLSDLLCLDEVPQETNADLLGEMLESLPQLSDLCLYGAVAPAAAGTSHRVWTLKSLTKFRGVSILPDIHCPKVGNFWGVVSATKLRLLLRSSPDIQVHRCCDEPITTALPSLRDESTLCCFRAPGSSCESCSCERVCPATCWPAPLRSGPA